MNLHTNLDLTYGLIEVRKKTIKEYQNKIKRYNETEPGTNVPGSAALWLFFYSPFFSASVFSSVLLRFLLQLCDESLFFRNNLNYSDISLSVTLKRFLHVVSSKTAANAVAM